MFGEAYMRRNLEYLLSKLARISIGLTFDPSNKMLY